jgi:hypothetical protein
MTGSAYLVLSVSTAWLVGVAFHGWVASRGMRRGVLRGAWEGALQFENRLRSVAGGACVRPVQQALGLVGKR